MIEDSNLWVFDSLVSFLNGPIWDAPIQNFIEEKSIIFEPNNENNEEYIKIFDEYKNLVDFMLGNYMEDIGITTEQFEYACLKGHENPIYFEQNIFEQIWAANDLEIFKRMMSQKNIELQLQALELIEHKTGVMPQLFADDKSEGAERHEKEKKPSKSADLEKEILAEVTKQFTSDPPVNFLSNENKMRKSQTLSDKIGESSTEDTKTELPAKTPKTFSDIDDIKKMNKPVELTNLKIDPLDIKKRQEYLRAQRDKLALLKKEERKKQFESNVAITADKNLRPKSAKAAEMVLSGNGANSPQKNKIRQALVERLKAEVVNSEKK